MAKEISHLKCYNDEIQEDMTFTDFLNSSRLERASTKSLIVFYILTNCLIDIMFLFYAAILAICIHNLIF